MKKSWKTTVAGVIAGGAIALSTGNCAPLVGMLPAPVEQRAGAIAGAAVVLMGVLAKDEQSEK